MTISFTGTQHGMTPQQRELLRVLLVKRAPLFFVHGGCIGADDTADAIAASLGIHRIVYPGPAGPKRVGDAELMARGPVTIMPARPTLQRNPVIVGCGDFLIACPKGTKEIVRSGTWTTVRHGRKQGKPVRILYP